MDKKVIIENAPTNAIELGKLVDKIIGEFIKDHGEECKGDSDNFFFLHGNQAATEINCGNDRMAIPVDITQIMYCKRCMAIDVILSCIKSWRQNDFLLYMEFMLGLLRNLSDKREFDDVGILQAFTGDSDEGISDIIDKLTKKGK